MKHVIHRATAIEKHHGTTRGDSFIADDGVLEVFPGNTATRGTSNLNCFCIAIAELFDELLDCHSELKLMNTSFRSITRYRKNL